MPILRLNVTPAGLSVHGSVARAGCAIQSAARGTGPVMVLVHGYKYDPETPRHCPHRKLFTTAIAPHAHHGWLRPLGFGVGDPDEGVAIALAWRARGNLWRARRAAHQAGQALARIIAQMRRAAAHRPIHIICHSMGSEVILEALRHLATGDVRRIVMIAGASYAGEARAVLSGPAGRGAEVFNITSRENDVFDRLFETLIPAEIAGDRALGAGLALRNAVDIQLDCPRTLARLTGFGAHIAPAQRRLCHWSGYTRAGALEFYDRALRHPDLVPLAALRAALPAAPAPRWSRMFAPWPHAAPLPRDQKTAS